MKVFETYWERFLCKILCKISDSTYFLHNQRDLDHWIVAQKKELSLYFRLLYEIAIWISFLIPIQWFHSLDMERTHLWTELILTIYSFAMSLKVLPLLFWSIAINLRNCLLYVMFFINDFKLFFYSIVRLNLYPRYIELGCMEYLKLYLSKNLDQLVKKMWHKSWHLTYSYFVLGTQIFMLSIILLYLRHGHNSNLFLIHDIIA